jgi:hypothetical protein
MANDEIVLSGSCLGGLRSMCSESTVGFRPSLSEILGVPPRLTESLEDQSRYVVGATLRHTYYFDESVVGGCKDYEQGVFPKPRQL